MRTADKLEKVMNRSVTRIFRNGEVEDVPFCPGTIADRLGMVWPLTVELAGVSGVFDAEQRLQRDATLLKRGRG